MAIGDFETALAVRAGSVQASGSRFFPLKISDVQSVAATLDPFSVDCDCESPQVPPLVITHLSGVTIAMLILDGATLETHDTGAKLAMLYGLSAAATWLALTLYSGATLQEAADERKISVNTARNQLQAVFEKMGCTRQSQVMRLVSDLKV